jgi:endonuclease YncB( thermonuclease family)
LAPFERLILLCLALLAAVPAQADISGRVVNVLEGDLLDVRQGSRVVRIRLADIDAPEPSQRFGADARRQLLALTKNKTARVQEQGMDLRGYTVARVVVNGMDLGLAQIQAGLAWQAERSSIPEYRQAEAEARQARRGLWRDLNPVPPWEWADMRQRSGRNR